MGLQAIEVAHCTVYFIPVPETSVGPALLGTLGSQSRRYSSILPPSPPVDVTTIPSEAFRESTNCVVAAGESAPSAKHLLPPLSQNAGAARTLLANSEQFVCAAVTLWHGEATTTGRTAWLSGCPGTVNGPGGRCVSLSKRKQLPPSGALLLVRAANSH